MGNWLQNIIIIFLVLTFFSSCKKPVDCFSGTGNIISIERKTEDFNNIVLNDDINLSMVQDSIQYLTIEAGENLMDEIITKVNEGSLLLENLNTCKYTRSYKKEINVSLHINNLQSIDYKGSARLYSSGKLNFDEFIFRISEGRGEVNINISARYLQIEHSSGNGIFNFKGEAENCFVYSIAMGLLDLCDLQVKNMSLLMESENNLYVWITDTLEAVIKGSGNIYYKGDPVIKKYEHSGNGQLLRLE